MPFNAHGYNQRNMQRALSGGVGSSTSRAIRTALSDPRHQDDRIPREGSVSTSKIAFNAVTRDKLDNLAVNSAKLDDDAVTNAKIGDLAVTGGKIQPNQINSGHLQDNSVVRARINADAVDGGKLASNAVSRTHISSGAVGSGEIDNGAVGSSQVANSLKGGSQGSETMRRIAGDGSSTSAAASDHAHSHSFKSLSKERRRHLIDLADRVAIHDYEDKSLSDLAELTLAVFAMQADDLEMDRYERERRIDQDPSGAFEHDLKMKHNPEYHARYMLLNDDQYRRVGALDNEYVHEIARELEESGDLVEVEERAYALPEEVLECEDGTLIRECDLIAEEAQAEDDPGVEGEGDDEDQVEG